MVHVNRTVVFNKYDSHACLTLRVTVRTSRNASRGRGPLSQDRRYPHSGNKNKRISHSWEFGRGNGVKRLPTRDAADVPLHARPGHADGPGTPTRPRQPHLLAPQRATPMLQPRCAVHASSCRRNLLQLGEAQLCPSAHSRSCFCTTSAVDHRPRSVARLLECLRTLSRDMLSRCTVVTW